MRLLLPAAIAVALTVVAAISYVRGAEFVVGELAVTSAWARATPPGADVGAAYVTVENRGTTADRLAKVGSPVAGMTMVHESAEESGVATMRSLENAVIPPGGKLEMQPGGTHLMLMKLAMPLKAGESIELTLTFEKAGSVTVPVEVAPMGAAGPAGNAM